MKRRNNKGFTLIEMLIVVGIIAILVAVSIPMVNSSLEKTRVATDMANERAAIAESMIMYLSGEMHGYGGKQMYYDAEHGTIVPDDVDVDLTPYGQCSGHKNGVIWIMVTEEGTPYLMWAHYQTGKSVDNPHPDLEGHDFIEYSSKSP